MVPNKNIEKILYIIQQTEKNIVLAEQSIEIIKKIIFHWGSQEITSEITKNLGYIIKQEKELKNNLLSKLPLDYIQ